MFFPCFGITTRAPEGKKKTITISPTQIFALGQISNEG